MPKTVAKLVKERQMTGKIEYKESVSIDLAKNSQQSRSFTITKPVKATWSTTAESVAGTNPLIISFSIENIPDSKIISSNYQFIFKMGDLGEKSGPLTSITRKYNIRENRCKSLLNGGKFDLHLTLQIKYVGHPRLRNKLYEPIGYNPTISFLKDMWNCSLLSDFKFIVKGKEFKVHTNVLAASSPVMHKIFTIKMAENKDGKSRINHIEPEAFEAMLNFVYGGEISENSDARELYATAHLYEIEPLMALCEQKVHTSLAVDNAVDMFLWAYPYEELEELKFDAWDIIKSKIVGELDIKKFETVDLQVIKDIVESVKVTKQLLADLGNMSMPETSVENGKKS